MYRPGKVETMLTLLVMIWMMKAFWKPAFWKYDVP
jgi:hypothetical protein